MCSGVGTNKDMIQWGGSMSVILRMLFGFFDYDAFISKNVGLGGGAAPFGAIVFWLCVVLGIIVSQNVMLAIVSQAYDNVRGQGESLTSRVPLWTNTNRRIGCQWCGRAKRKDKPVGSRRAYNTTSGRSVGTL